jgi:serine/threonine protein kinase
MPLTPGANFGPYRVIDQLGKGGMASVFKAYEPDLDRYIALKVLPTEFLHDEMFAARFTQEAKVVARLEHKEIIPIFAFGIEQNVPWMAMRLIAGGTLASLLAQERVPLARCVAILRGVANALTYAHEQGVIHRDVKPQNVLLDQLGQVYLADFGIARMVEGATVLTKTGALAGTPQYMAPEQALARPVDHRVDIYALGIVAYQMFVGDVPFNADTPIAVMMKHVNEPIPLAPLRAVPEPVRRSLLKALAKEPRQRWSSAGEFADSLERGLDAAAVDAGATTAPRLAEKAAHVSPAPRTTYVVPPKEACPAGKRNDSFSG